MKRICVLGLGYIGLPTALLLAKNGFEVTGVDTNPEVIRKLERGQLHFQEPGLSDLFDEARQNFTPSSEIRRADTFIIAVPTPLLSSIHIADLSHVTRATDMISTVLDKGNLVILESTVPPGTCENLIKKNLDDSFKGEYLLAHSPERAMPGKTLEEMVNNDRIIGGFSQEAYEKAMSIYESFVKGNIYLTETKTAEIVKLMENTYRDVNIALANEFAMIAEDSGINIWEAIALANKHPRVDILDPGPGVGGHCISIDPWFLSSNSTNSRMINLAREINDSMPNVVLNQIRKMVQGINNPNITILGVAYKGNVDDVRESPALKLIKLAKNEGFNVRCHDPHVTEFEYELMDLKRASKNTDCIILVTDHEEFSEMVPRNLEVRNKNLIDCRNTIDLQAWKKNGYKVKILGSG